MYYASFGILAVIHHLILNKEILREGNKYPANSPHFRYRQYLIALLVFYIADLIWGFLEQSRIRPLVYADTVLFFATMAMSVVLWTRYVVAFLDKQGIRSTSFLAAGWIIFAFVILSLLINFFYPVIFTFTEDSTYIPYAGRYILLAAQFLLFALITVYSLFVSLKTTGRDRVHYRAVCLSGGAMTVFIVFQTMYPFAPLYTIACMMANCLIHVYVEEDEKNERDRITADAEKDRERYSQIATSLAKDYDAIYYINIENGTFFEVSSSEAYRTLDIVQYGIDFYAETRENARRLAHPDDRDFAVSMYYKDTMLKNLEGKKSYSYKYRIMIDDEARYYQFVVILSDDGKHFVLCDKDIHDTITAETALLEKQQANITFTRIAESLASNYDVIYYVDILSGQYTGFTSHNIYGELKINEYGNNFFDDAATNVSRIIHPKDREKILKVIDRDHMLSLLEGRKRYSVEYRLIINDSSQHTRMIIRKSSEGKHFIIGVENINEEVKKEKEHLRALNTEKELARRDELTGTRNKTAYTELEKSLQSSIDNGVDYLPFAIAVCDLNDLKKINDSKGHKAGDDYIRSSARLLCRIFDHSPVFRIGGDEFVVFLKGEDYTARNRLMEQLHSTVLSNLERHDGPVIASGIAEYKPESDTSVTDIFDRADHLMYEDKRELKQHKS
ncbi:MAG TPA: GGDEF domain-containing protein [Lachnospiraceae bacterium]|nr:GGDEF domain-containing protein [Lachnospiraceae bacterium]